MPTEEDDNDHAIIATTTVAAITTTLPPQPPGTNTAEITPSHQPDRPVKPKPSTTKGASPSTSPTDEEQTAEPAASSNSNWLPSFLPTLGVSASTQVWIYGSLALIVVFCCGLGIYFFMARRKRLRNNPREDYEFELLDEEEAEGLAGGAEKRGMAGKSARKTRGGELYDAFAGGSDDEDEDGPSNQYHDRTDSASPPVNEKRGGFQEEGSEDGEGVHHVVGGDDDSDDDEEETQALRGARR